MVGARAYVAAGLVYVIDTAANTVVNSFTAEVAPIAGVSTTASSVVISPETDSDHAYVVDRLTHAIERVDFSNDGELAEIGVTTVLISANGRVVAFDSGSGNLVEGDGDVAHDVFVHDRKTGRTEGGEVVVFSSRASSLVRRDTNQAVDVFRRDLEERKTERLAADDRIDEFRPFGFDVVATDITPKARKVALLTRADLEPEQDVGFFVADVYALETGGRR